MRTLNGLSGPTPPPRMMGLELPAGMAIPSQPAPPQPLPTRPAPAPPPGAFAPATFPPLAPDKASAYQTAFEQLDGDRDGLVQGVDCFPTLMRSGLPKEILKTIWDVVAGDEGHLNRHQFVQCLYLVDCAKLGLPVPATLPPGQFPPTQGGIGLQSMMGRSQQPDIYTSGPLFIAPMVPKASYVPGPAPAVAFQSQVPPAPTSAQLSGLAAAESARLAAEREEALRQEAERQRAEEERVAAAARREFYTQSLANLRVAQSKVARTLNEAQQRLEMERREAESMENQYNAAYEGFSAEHARAAPLLDALKKMEDEKADLTAKLAALQTAVAQLEEYDPEWEAREAAECEGLKKNITELAVKHEALQQARAVTTAQRDTLEASVAAVKDAAGKAQAHVEALTTEVAGLSAEAKKEGAVVVALLQKLAPLYNELYAAAKAAMVPLPKEALATIARPPASAFKYDPIRFGSSAVDWDVFTDEGFTITAAVVPDSRLLSLTSTSLAQAEDGDKTAEESLEGLTGGEGEEKETEDVVGTREGNEDAGDGKGGEGEGDDPPSEVAAVATAQGDGEDPPAAAAPADDPEGNGTATSTTTPADDKEDASKDGGSLNQEISVGLDGLTLEDPKSSSAQIDLDLGTRTGKDPAAVPAVPSAMDLMSQLSGLADIPGAAAEEEVTAAGSGKVQQPAAAEHAELLLLGEDTSNGNKTPT